MTQTNSRQRCKVDLIGDAGMKQLFAYYQAFDLVDFKSYCKDVVESSSGKRQTKDRFIHDIDMAPNKDIVLKKVTNYILAGQGLGV